MGVEIVGYSVVPGVSCQEPAFHLGGGIGTHSCAAMGAFLKEHQQALALLIVRQIQCWHVCRLYPSDDEDLGQGLTGTACIVPVENQLHAFQHVKSSRPCADTRALSCVMGRLLVNEPVVQ